MKLPISLTGLLASCLVLAPVVAEGEAEKASVRGLRLEGAPDDLKEKREQLYETIDLIRNLQAGWGDIDPAGEGEAPPAVDEDGYGGGYYYDKQALSYLLGTYNQIKKYIEAHKAQLVYGLGEVKDALRDASYGQIDPHNFNHDHEAHTENAGTHDHGAYRGKLSGYTEKYSGDHGHEVYIQDNGEHEHFLPELKCRCFYDHGDLSNFTTSIAGEHYHGAHVKKGGEHDHGVKVTIDPDGEHVHNVTVKDSENLDYITHKTDLFDDLGEAADALWDLVEKLKSKPPTKYYPKD
uniref:Uncharacterized protein n=1 Tax=Pseudictyota dubia TaxID=2749911 RepID=A0A7R9VW04_9STRA